MIADKLSKKLQNRDKKYFKRFKDFKANDDWSVGDTKWDGYLGYLTT